MLPWCLVANVRYLSDWALYVNVHHYYSRHPYLLNIQGVLKNHRRIFQNTSGSCIRWNIGVRAKHCRKTWRNLHRCCHTVLLAEYLCKCMDFNDTNRYIQQVHLCKANQTTVCVFRHKLYRNLIADSLCRSIWDSPHFVGWRRKCRSNDTVTRSRWCDSVCSFVHQTFVWEWIQHLVRDRLCRLYRLR